MWRRRPSAVRSPGRQQLLLEAVLTSNNMTSLHNFVVQGGGISISSEVSVRHLVAVPIRERGMGVRYIEVQTLAGRSLPQAVLSFLDCLKQHLSGQTGPDRAPGSP